MCTVIEEIEVTAVNLSLYLEQAVIRHDVDDEREIYITETGWFPFWIQVRRKSAQLILSTHTMFRRSTGTLQRYEFVNEVNSKFVLVSAFVDGKRLRVDHALLYRDGLTRESFIRTCRVFNDSLTRAMSELDPDGSILLAPGETEDSDQENAQDPQ
jgi:hypothetical protein